MRGRKGGVRRVKRRGGKENNIVGEGRVEKRVGKGGKVR